MLNHNIDSSVAYRSLSTETTPTISKATLFKLFALAGVLFIAFNILIYFFFGFYDNHNGESNGWHSLEQLTEPVDVIILGDSVAASGISPDIIEAYTGLTAHNFGLNAWWVYFNDVWLLERYIEKFGPPKVVIWGHNYEVANRQFNPVQQLGTTSYPYGFTWWSQYVELDLTQQEKATIITRRLFPLYYRQNTLMTVLTDISHGKNLLHNNRTDNGLSIHMHVAPDNVTQKARNRAWSLYGLYMINRENQQVSDAFFELIHQYDIPTYIFITPVHRIVKKNDKFLPSIRIQLDYWHDVSLRYDNVRFNPEIPTFDSDQMRDGIHLNEEGAEIYTEYLIDWIWGNYVAPSIEEIYTDLE